MLATAAGLALLPAAASPARPAQDRDRSIEVVVALAEPPLARAVASGRTLAGAVTSGGRLDLDAPRSVSYLRSLTAAQRRLERRIVARIPTARVRWRYRVVLNGLAVLVPPDKASLLASLPGVARVYPTVTYGPLLDTSPAAIGAPLLWGRNLSSAGNGLKIAVLDDGIDHRHPFFDPRPFRMPAGFPRGEASYVSAKVIVARAFPPPSPRWQYAARPVDPAFSAHGTHVAGIAAGVYGTAASPPPPRRSTSVSGVAPNAYLGNYKVLTIPTVSGVGLNGNSPEIAAGIEAAVRDGMDVINLSLGEPEIEPARDLVVAAVNGAADAGVVPVVAAGNDFQEFGRGSISSPASAAKAITAGAVTRRRAIADFSSSGPTPLSLRLKPDVTAPGVAILSSVPARGGLWSSFSGTSMAAPHVAGGAALLRQRHPSWTVAQLKSALVLTGGQVYRARRRAVAATRQGGAAVNLPRADRPLIFAAPATLSFGLLRKPGRRQTALRRQARVAVTDAGGGVGRWSLSVEPSGRVRGVFVRAPRSLSVPAAVRIRVSVTARAPAREFTGFLVFRRGPERRRLPFWFRVTAPALPGRASRVLRRPGTYRGNTRGRRADVDRYRYPDNPLGAGIQSRLPGPEQVFRVRLRRRVANFGVAVLSRRRGVRVQPRVVAGADQNRQLGYTALPINLNPYLPAFRRVVPVAGAVLPAPGLYSIVFDTPSAAAAGRFRFRFWVGDTTPPRVRVLSRSVRRGAPLLAVVSDRGAGVDPRSIYAFVDGRRRSVRYSPRTGRASISLRRLTRGLHRLVLQASDHQEAKNMENVARILPNTEQLRTTFRIR